MRYFRPKSLTWWSSIVAIVLGVTTMVCARCDFVELASLVAMLNGGYDSSPAALIMLGLVGLGLGDKMERQYGDRND